MGTINAAQQEEQQKPQTASSFGSIKYQIEREAKNAETNLKQEYIRKLQVETKFEHLQYASERKKAIEQLALCFLGEAHINKMEMRAKARQEMFQQPNVLGYLTRGQLKIAAGETVLITGSSGGGKTTTSISLAATAHEMGYKLVYLNNEQTAEDIYYKIASGLLSIPFEGIDRLNTEQSELLFKLIQEHLCKSTLVVDDEYGDTGGETTTSIEGIRKCLQDLLRENPFDLAILDYYQQVCTSVDYPEIEEWKVHEMLVHELSKFRSKSKMPIIIMAQIREDDGKKKLKDRLEGRKIIINKVDVVLEIISSPKTKEACLLVHKCRSNGSLRGHSFPLTFDGARYHPMSKEV